MQTKFKSALPPMNFSPIMGKLTPGRFHTRYTRSVALCRSAAPSGLWHNNLSIKVYTAKLLIITSSGIMIRLNEKIKSLKSRKHTRIRRGSNALTEDCPPVSPDPTETLLYEEGQKQEEEFLAGVRAQLERTYALRKSHSQG